MGKITALTARTHLIEPSVCYKKTHANAKIDPTSTWTGIRRDPRFSPPADGGRPENALQGTIFNVNCCQAGAIQVSQAEGKMRFWRNTDFAVLGPGQTGTTSAGVLGIEWDESPDDIFTPPGIIRLSTTVANGVSYLQDYGSTYASGTATHRLSMYRASSGAIVFSTATMRWSWGLDDHHTDGSTDPYVRMAAGHPSICSLTWAYSTVLFSLV